MPQLNNLATVIVFTLLSASPVLSQSINVLDEFVPSGWMGDGEHGPKYLNLESAPAADPDDDHVAVRIAYRQGPNRWAGIYWQNSANNWGEKQGKDLSGYQCLTFKARGEVGGEVVEFKAGGIEAEGRPYQDTFETSIGSVRLEEDWKSYTMSLNGKDLSNVIGGFAVVFTASPGELAFFVDDIEYQMSESNCSP